MITTVRGVRDILPEEMPAWLLLESAARRVFSQYGYQELRTPIFEKTELFARAIGETTDIIEKEMYTFPDRGGDSLTLRPEGTAAVVRAFLENGLYRQLPWAVFYMGPMFRYERPQKGRYRQFHQIGCELFGAEGPLADAEMMAMVLRYLRSLGLDDTLTLEINSLGCAECRMPYRAQLLLFLRAHTEGLCDNCRQRLERNPLRILDCKRENCRTIASSSPFMKDHLCSPCAVHFQGLTSHLTDLNRPFIINPLMVRGLDYYNRTAFEVTTTALGAQNAVVAGGRYDGLVAELGAKPNVPAIGFAMGMERLALLLNTVVPPSSRPAFYLIAVGDESRGMAVRLAERLRDAGFSLTLDGMGGSMKSQMKRADRSNARFVLILGEREMAQACIIAKRMLDGEQTILPWQGLESPLNALLAE